MIAATRVPTHRNDGSKISRRELRGILTKVRKAFRGDSFEGPFEGAWVAKDGHVYEEMIYRLEVVVSCKRAKQAKALFMSIGAQLGQRAIYFELREGGEIVDLE
jgi:hypothetical protein